MKSQETAELSKLTLVMATYGRQDHAIRNMRYWSNTGVVFLVLDASPNPIENNLLKNFGNNILYVHDQSDYNERIANSFSKINTKYTQLICDDEFYPISSVISSIKELEKNEKIISCMGVCLGFEVDKKNKKIFSKRIYERLISNYNYTMNSDPFERMSGYMINYIPFLMYAMIRSETWKKAFFLPIKFKREKDIKNNLEKFNFFASDETQINMYLSFAGKSKVLPELYWLRSFGEHLTIRELHDQHKEPKLTFEKWWRTSNQRSKYLEILEDSFKETKIKINISYKEMALKCCHFFLNGGGGDYSKTQLLFIKKEKSFIFLIFFYLKKLLPSFLKDYIKSLSFWRRRRLLFNDEVYILKNKGIKVDLNKLNEIQKIIENFHFK